MRALLPAYERVLDEDDEPVDRTVGVPDDDPPAPALVRPPRWRALHPAKPGKLSVWTTPRFPDFSPSVKRKPCFR